MMTHSSMDYIYYIEDEIALEGLDGITVEGLWLRLNSRPNFINTLTLDDDSKEFLWNFIIENEEISFFALEEPRPPLKIFNRYEYIDSEMGMVLEPKEHFEDIYPSSPVNDEDAGIRGSCATYNTRVDVTNEIMSLSLQDALLKYGNQLVMVASQPLRDKALAINTTVDKFYDLTLMQYVLLERIGRSRTLGEITNGKNSLASIYNSPKTLFYFRKRLLKLNLITKQSHQQRSVKGVICSSSLLNLTRFYVTRKPKYMLIIQQVMDILKRNPNCICPMSSVKEEIGMAEIVNKKFFKNSEFLKYIQVVIVPYRQIYNDATENEWSHKKRSEEKTIRCYQQVNPDLNSEDLFQDDNNEELEDADEDEASPGILDQSKLIYGRSLLQQAYMMIEAAGPDGMSQIDVSRALGQKKLDSRSICRRLVKRNVIHSLMKDIGRQRVSRYVSNRFASTGHLLQEFETERKKMLEIVEKSKKGVQDVAVNELEDIEEQVLSYKSSIPSTSRVMELDSPEKVEIGLEMNHSGSRMTATVHEKSESPIQASNSSAGEGGCGTMLIKQQTSVVDNGIQWAVSLEDSKAWTHINQKKITPHLTTRLMKRANLIMKEVHKHKVIDDAFKLQKLIIDSEMMEGSKIKMDKKSLVRILDRLSRSGFLKKIVVKIKTGNKTKDITFVVDSSITLESSLLKVAIEQHKLKFLAQTAASTLAKKENCTDDATPQEDCRMSKDSTQPYACPEKSTHTNMKEDITVGESVLELEQMHDLPTTKPPVTANTAESLPETAVRPIKGPVGPKFVRMQELHKLLFYLVYDYEGQVDLLQDDAWKVIVESSAHDFSREDFSQYPQVFTQEISWRMFIPPIPHHTNFSLSGWIFVADILLRLPLCIFIQIVNIVSQSSLLLTYLNHPIKQNILVKSLPPELRKLLLSSRRYVNYVMDLCRRLCYIGLLQLGHQLMKEKDQIFVFINRHATLIDTTTSNPAYHYISSDKEYVCKEYTFISLKDVIQYWYDMWTICMHTSLGGQMYDQGKKIIIQMLAKKPEMIETLKPRSLEEAPLMDIGHIPGDGKGAAGLDSAMFAHLKRNWSCLNARFPTPTSNAALPTNGNSEKPPVTDKMFSYAQYLRNSCRPNCVDNSAAKNRAAGALRNVKLSLYKPKRDDSKSLAMSGGLASATKRPEKEAQKQEDDKIVSKMNGKSKKSFQREIKLRFKAPKKPYYDEEDKAALRRMKKLRVEWNPAEDALLLLCKVASTYLFPTKRVKVINSCMIRDVLHSHYPESRNKTSRACQRRLHYMLKNPATEENVYIILQELKQDEEITKHFKPTKLFHQLPLMRVMHMNLFKDLVHKLVAKYSSNKCKEAPDLPDSYHEFRHKFNIIQASHSIKEGEELKEIVSLADIDQYVVTALIFSSLCTKQDRESWAYQLYLAYQKYPQNLLNSVLSSIRETKMISYKKCYNRSEYTRTCLPLSTSPFQISLSFIYLFHMKYQFRIFGDSWNFTKQLLAAKNRFLFQSSCESTSKSTATSTLQTNIGSTDDPEHKEILVDRDPNKTNLTDNRVEPKKKRKRTKLGCKVNKMPRKSRKMGFQSPSSETVNRGQNLEHCSNLDVSSNSETSQMKLTESQSIEDRCEEMGIALPVSIPGGACAALIALMMIKRLDFYITIPDQMIVIDHQSPDNLKANKLLKKVQQHELMTGKESLSAALGHIEEQIPCPDEDIYMDNEPIDNSENSKICMDNKVQEEPAIMVPQDSQEPSQQNSCLSHQDSMDNKEHLVAPATSGGVTKRKFSEVDEEESDKQKKVKTNAVDENDKGCAMDTEDEAVATSVEDKKAKSRFQYSHSRFRMYMMREQMEESMIPPTFSWAFDHVFINTCEISCRLRHHSNMEPKLQLPGDPEEVISACVPLTQETINEALAVRKRVILNNCTKLESAKEEWKKEGKDSEYINLTTSIFRFIESKKEFGASATEIKENLGADATSKLHAMKILREMAEINLILRVGIDTFRWVTIQYSKPWLIRTNKMSRGKMLSSESVRLSGVYEVKTTNVENPTDTPNHEPSTSDQQPNENKDGEVVQRESTATDSLAVPSSSADPKSVTQSVQNIRPRMALLKNRYRKDSEAVDKMEKALNQHLSTDHHEEIDVLVRPWVRLNGCLNRRVMDRLLGAVLCYIMEQPGIPGYKIAKRFWPGLQPAHTYELIETLVMISTVKRFYARKSHKVTLFSKPQSISIEPAAEFDYDDNMLYEAEVDAVLKLSMFIGDKKYSQDFLDTSR